MRASAGTLADRLAHEVLVGHGLRCRPKVDPWALAGALGVTVLDADLLEDGRMLWNEGSPVVMLARDAGEERRRFTLAHELGHVVLRMEHLRSPLAAATRAAFKSEEVLCDALAGGMLMPRPWVERRFEKAPHALATVVHLALAAGVSLSAAVVRLREVHRWQRTLLHWRLEGKRWVFHEEAGLWPAEMGIIKPSEGTTWSLHDLRRRGVVTGAVQLPLRIGERDRDVQVEVRLTRARAIVLLDSPSRLIGKSPSRPADNSPSRLVGKGHTSERANCGWAASDAAADVGARSMPGRRFADRRSALHAITG